LVYLNFPCQEIAQKLDDKLQGGGDSDGK
jgi:hypothetical protein